MGDGTAGTIRGGVASVSAPGRGVPTAPEDGGSTECRLDRLEVVENDRIVTVEVSANRFLRKMVRALTGTLLEVGRGKRPPEWMDEVIEARDRGAAGLTVPPQGLFLISVDYPESRNGG